MKKKIVAVSMLGIQLDFFGKRTDRWSKWRPNVSLCSQEDMVIDHLHLIHDNHSSKLANTVVDDIATISPETEVGLHTINFINPWDFEEVYAKLFDWCKQQTFDTDTYD
jgi:transcriptional regulatory protein RtcR